MVESPNCDDVAAGLFGGIVLIARRLKLLQAPGQLTLPERAALERLDHEGPASGADLARAEQITPQAMGATIAALESRGLVSRRPDPADGRRVMLSLTTSGVKILQRKRDARTRHLAKILKKEFSDAELQTLAAAAPLIKRLGAQI
ncbi:MarR family transcriptional regulator [Mycobacterium saskatchewanense]|uniref:MarR family transcriptional regulator n=1 Tax=Mycobacterium saskatchewanense TaxID=220927 RepID=A0AAJ3NR91_9MYCO|nr:MarR family transcriptional regulator [Mycobacterium saskatchewanense]ORW71691.1 MarR family transcriptional regulator [Mycobacterium saskatchewanense]BBX63511.1 MarR family transcriptional regulator [Mycobacterium saskatchewanense]